MSYSFGRLKEIREEKGLTQKDVAKFLGINQVQYSRYETGVRIIPVDKLEKLADFYNTSVDYLLYRTDIREKYKESVLAK